MELTPAKSWLWFNRMAGMMNTSCDDYFGKLKITNFHSALDLLGANSTIGQLLGSGMLLDVADGAQDLLWDWWWSGQEVGLWVEAELIGGVHHLDGNTLGRDVGVRSVSFVSGQTLLLDLDTAGLLDIIGVGAVRILVGQELGDGIIVQWRGQGASEKGDDEKLLV